MSASRLASRYAKALITESLQQGKVDQVHEDITSLIKLFDDREFALMVKSPIINAGKKKAIFKALLEGKVDGVTESFINILISKGRESQLEAVVDSFDEQYCELKKRSDVKITTAAPVDQAQLAELRAKIIESKVTHPDVRITSIVDPEIVGGFVMDIADRKYDASVKGKLDELRKTFSDDSYSKKF